MRRSACKKALREELAGLEDVLYGSLVGRMMRCGKKGCRCHRDPPYRHGPMYYLSDNRGGKTRWVYVRQGKVAEVEASLGRGERAQEILKELGELRREELGLGRGGGRRGAQ